MDEFLKNIQLTANSPNKVMEWIPYNRLFVKNHIGKGGFGIVNLARGKPGWPTREPLEEMLVTPSVRLTESQFQKTIPTKV